jgi:hypothetical protein
MHKVTGLFTVTNVSKTERVEPGCITGIQLLLRITVPADAPLNKFFLRKKGFTHHSILPFL